ncbi:MAG: phytoene/squalene synthase family protein [Methanolobus sp.]|nr:phytoene/squalene synthase family protein [Methanolobus sp.]
MIDKTIHSIFKRGSKTYYYSTIFFPKEVKKDVFTLYSFLRKADDYVDAIPQDVSEFYAFWQRYEMAMKGEMTGDIVVDSFADLSRLKGFDPLWTNAFLKSMEMDITISEYESFDELKKYLYGSSEVVGLFMACIMGLPKESYNSARYLGRAMQYMNFIRDIDEDIALGRIYFPKSELRKHGLQGLGLEDAQSNKDGFEAFIKEQIDVYKSWQVRGEEGYCFIPRRYLIPIRTASDMYTWTGDQIYRDPLVVYRKKVKPRIPRIVSTIIANSLRSFRL